MLIVSQLQDVFNQVSIWETTITYRFNRKRRNDDVGDIYDGALYRKKPFMLSSLKPFHSIFHQLETDGVEILNPKGENITVRAILLCGTCDLPARCLVCNSIQFNGFYGCLRCRQAGKSCLPFQHRGSKWPCSNQVGNNARRSTSFPWPFIS